MNYNNWANRHLVKSAGELSPDELTADAALSSSSAFNTLRHMLDVEWSWRQVGHSPEDLDFLDFIQTEAG